LLKTRVERLPQLHVHYYANLKSHKYVHKQKRTKRMYDGDDGTGNQSSSNKNRKRKNTFAPLMN
jgi:hypothetical protein